MIKASSKIDSVSNSHCFNAGKIIPDVLSIGSTTGERQVEMSNQINKSIHSQVMHANSQFGRYGESLVQASVAKQLSVHDGMVFSYYCYYTH